MIEGDEKDGVCTWCKRPVVLVWRAYPADSGCTGSFWSVEQCPCFDFGTEAYGRRVLNHLKNSAHEPRKYRNGVPIVREGVPGSNRFKESAATDGH